MSISKTSDIYTIPAWLARVIVVVLFAGAITLTVWRWSEFQLVKRQMNSAIAQETRLLNELQQFEMRWDPIATAKSEADFRKVQALLFSGPEQIANWQSEVQRLAHTNLLEGNVKLSAAETRVKNDQKLSVNLATVDLEPAADAPASNSIYRGLLNFARALQTLPKRLDLVEVSAMGGSNSIARAQVVLQLWSREGNP